MPLLPIHRTISYVPPSIVPVVSVGPIAAPMLTDVRQIAWPDCARGPTSSVVLARIREKNLQNWLPAYLRDRLENVRRPPYRGHRHLLFAFCDHFEPYWRRPPREVAHARVRTWHERYPKLASEFRDADGRPPRHSFFFPGEEYEPEFLERLGDLASDGLGEVELHLHHDGDTAAELRRKIQSYLGIYAGHGHLSRDAGTGRPRYAFIHGNWCLANARRDGRWCGVDDELPLLFETGCYADLTFPAAPDESQPGIVNRIYWPDGDLARARAYERGRPARAGEAFDDRLLMIEGPLALARRGRFGVRIESAAVTAADPGTPSRVATWTKQEIHVEGRPDWVFVKVHTHGAPEAQAASLLGEGGRSLHQALARYNDGVNWSLHYVTARELYNVARAAMDGRAGNPAEYFDHLLAPPPIAVAARQDPTTTTPARSAGSS